MNANPADSDVFPQYVFSFSRLSSAVVLPHSRLSPHPHAHKDYYSFPFCLPPTRLGTVCSLYTKPPPAPSSSDALGNKLLWTRIPLRLRKFWNGIRAVRTLLCIIIQLHHYAANRSCLVWRQQQQQRSPGDGVS